MTKWLDYFLVIALVVNIVTTLLKYEPTYKAFDNVVLPTWVALVIQALCIGLIVYKRVKMKR